MNLRAVLLAFLLVGCPPKKKLDTDSDEDLAPPEVKLQVVGVDPPTAKADHSVDVEVIGSAFEKGARVSFSGTAAEGVRFVDENTLAVIVPALPPGSYDVTVSNPDGTKATLRRGLTLANLADLQQVDISACQSVIVSFGFDQSVLTPETRRQLDGVANCLRSAPGELRIEGHCDERGTTDYNLALGQRRADAVQRYLVGLGISPARMRAVSFGEERPADRSGGASADARNRRAEILVR
jgi:outer membrane protein OmpA-like peptidoglycan-associated protein